MLQTKLSVEDTHIQFLSNFRVYGFKDESAMLRAAMEHFEREREGKVELDSLKASAELYAETYSNDDDLNELTEAAMTGWPE